MKKKMIVLLTAVLLIGALAGCGSSSTKGNNQSNAGASQSETKNETQESETKTSENATTDNITSEGGKVLVVYYSATGNTKNVANYIAIAADGDTFELVPVNPYTSDDLNWSNNNSRVSVEHNDESKRNVELTSTTVENWDSYDTVFIGYPIWWGIAAWPVNSFVESNDFSGKTVIPFCTAASSGLGESVQLLAKMAGNGEWQEGEKFGSNASEKEVSGWVSGLKY